MVKPVNKLTPNEQMRWGLSGVIMIVVVAFLIIGVAILGLATGPLAALFLGVGGSVTLHGLGLLRWPETQIYKTLEGRVFKEQK